MKSRHSVEIGSRVRDILARSAELKILDLAEVSTLLTLQDRDVWDEVFEAARAVKEKVYGRRIVLFAPLYLSNECANDCLYCGFRRGNKEARRKTLSIDEAVTEASLLAGKGYRRLLLVSSEHERRAGIDFLERIIDALYARTDIRILHMNSAPMDVAGFRRLKSRGVGVYQCFQETYHIPTYRMMHRSGPKSDYSWRLGVMDRAIEAGFEDVGMGVLLGLYDWRWEVGALIAHSRRLIQKYGFGPHTLSVPRLRPADGAEADSHRYSVSDADLKKIVAIFRLALPYVGVVISTREPSELRDDLVLTGASQVSAGSKTSPLGYLHDGDTEQFLVGDRRSLEEMIARLMTLGLVPSLCTACYRKGRSGEQFRHLAEGEALKSVCQENALLSLKEFLQDSASEEVRGQLITMLRDESERSTNGLARKFQLVEQGHRDVHS